MGLATPRTHETISPDAGPQRDHQTPPSPVNEAPSSNGRATIPLAPVSIEHVSSTRLATPSITLEFALYGVILIAAVLTRFWDLGSRALHHDESLHAYFSWLLATGQGYVHDPLMHGPFLFHFTALIFALFGDSDASSRFGPALFGVILVALPILLRGPRHLGRWGALTASALILISPSLLYQSRYLRHDIFTVAGALFLLIAIVRYVEQPSRGWLIAIGVTLGFLLTNHEIVFGIAAIFVAIIVGALLWGNLRPLAPVLIAAGIVAIALVAFLPDVTGRSLPEIPWSHPTQSQQFDFYRELLTNPLTISMLLLAVVTIAGCALVLRLRYDAERHGENWAETLFGSAPSGSIAGAVREAWLDRVGLSATLIAGLFIFAVLFTTLFTNLYGLASGTISTDGTLLYWLGQHDYRRGEQPWFYYALLLPQYEFIAALMGTIATIFIGVRMLLVGLGRAKPGPRFVFQSFLAIWFVGILLALSWAGEKMPWLVTHISLPAVLLAAVLLGEVWERWRPVIRETGDGRRETGDIWRVAEGWGVPQWALLGGLLGLAACWFLLAAPMTFGEFVTSTLPGGWERTLAPWAQEHWWLLAVPPLVGIVAIGVAWLRRGGRLAMQPALVALVVVLALAQVHVAWRLVYQEGDVPKDMLVYTQTSPDMQRMVGELTILSEMTTGGPNLEVWYDDNNGVSWPMQWYLRDFPNRHLFGSTLAGPPDGVPIVLVGNDNRTSVEPYLEGYTAQEYALRWWFPERIYRDFAIAPEITPSQSAWGSASNPHGPMDIARSILSSVSTLRSADAQQQLYRLVMYRDLPSRIDDYGYTIYIRNDLVPLYNQIRY